MTGGLPIAVIAGPTASGKTECAHDLAARIPIEIIVCDSMQVYRGMDILSQAPSPEDRARHPYHLAAFLDPSEEYNAALFAADCRRLAGEIHARGRLPLMVCGTGFYLTAFVQGVAAGPGEDPAVREALRRRAGEEGPEALYRELQVKDAVAARAMHPKDVRRVIRALELIAVTGRPCSELKARREAPGRDCRIRVWGLQWDRDILYRRIDERVERMAREGLEEEARKLLSWPGLSKTARSCLGMPEMESFAAGRISRDEALAALKQNTRRFAKRQMTWFRHHEPVRWIPVDGTSGLAEAKRILSQEVPVWWRGVE